ncbi:MAG TPA: phenylalanine--tRNA ligase beta subunit-related protein [Patescibacteria group bacterium]|nr:phenylalanine--tRNA ligase beta subunit-related protein [Patescibacteria group bacterium]
MQIKVEWSQEVSQKFPELAICVGMIQNIKVKKENEQTRILKKKTCEEARANYDAETLKDNPTVRAYRSMYWKLGIDPTKTRPSGEALLRRVLHDKNLPTISTAVDAYNLASMKTIVPISGFDCERLTPPFQVRFARGNEKFAGIGMTEPIALESKMLVFGNGKQVLCIYPYRNCDHTKITLKTHTAMIVGYGTPGLSPAQLREAVKTTLSFIKQVSGGEIEAVETFQSTAGKQ